MENAYLGETNAWNILGQVIETCMDDNLVPLSPLGVFGTLNGILKANALSQLEWSAVA